VRTLKAGASGFINKQFATDELVTAIRAVLAGQNYLGAAATRKLVADVSPDAARAAHEKLSRREFQIFNLVALGKSVKEIAAELGLSGKTVGTYLARIKEKTGLCTPVEIARYAFQNKLVE
jgi:DNA-binding NarL/FixJ family response regulator